MAGCFHLSAWISVDFFSKQKSTIIENCLLAEKRNYQSQFASG